jgi:hypothetical protein
VDAHIRGNEIIPAVACSVCRRPHCQTFQQELIKTIMGRR